MVKVVVGWPERGHLKEQVAGKEAWEGQRAWNFSSSVPYNLCFPKIPALILSGLGLGGRVSQDMIAGVFREWAEKLRKKCKQAGGVRRMS